jgi:hypothetical protein
VPDREALGLREVSGFKGNKAFTEGMSPATIHIGARLQSGDVQVQAATLLTTTQDRLTPGVNVGIGYVDGAVPNPLRRRRSANQGGHRRPAQLTAR